MMITTAECVVRRVPQHLEHCRLRTSSGLSKGIHVPVQPPQIAQQTQIFYRLVQQAVAIKPATFKQTVDTATKRKSVRPQPVGEPELNGYPVLQQSPQVETDAARPDLDHD
jgi:hypothetical protein